LKLLTAHSRRFEQPEFWHLSPQQLAQLWPVVASQGMQAVPMRVLI
jgi:hypothetical protein